MFDTVAKMNFSNEYLQELTLCEIWLIYINEINEKRLEAYLQNPYDKENKIKKFEQLFKYKQ